MAATEQQMKELTVTERAQRALSIEHTETDLKALAAKYADVTEIKDDTDYQLVKRAHLELGGVRVVIEKAGKAARDDANAFAKAVIAEQKRLVGYIQPEEDRLKALRKAVDDEEARKADEARRVEEERIDSIKRLIAEIRGQAEGLLNSSSEQIASRIKDLENIRCCEEVFAEFTEQAMEIKTEILDQLYHAHDSRKAFEEQKAEADRIAAEQAARQAELDRQAEEQRKREEAARKKLEDEQAELRRQQEAIEAEKRAEEQRKLAAERAEAERVRQEKEALERQQREREAAEQKRLAEEAEAARQEALRPEKDRLRDWVLKLRTIDGIELKDKDLAKIQRGVLDGLNDLALKAVERIEAV